MSGYPQDGFAYWKERAKKAESELGKRPTTQKTKEKIVKLEAEIERLRKVAETYSKELIENHDDELKLLLHRDHWKARAEAAEARAERYAFAVGTLPDRFENGVRDVECIFCGCDADDWEKHAHNCIKAEVDHD